MLGVKKIILVQLYSNGDCLYATTIAAQIKKDFPGCHLTWAIASFCKSIIDNNPHVDSILATDEVPKNDVVAFRKFKIKVLEEKNRGKWDEVFITQNRIIVSCITANILNGTPLCVSPQTSQAGLSVFFTK